VRLISFVTQREMTIPDQTIRVYARTIHRESQEYGFAAIDIIRLVNELLDLSATEDLTTDDPAADSNRSSHDFCIDEFPIRSNRLRIRRAVAADDIELIQSWIEGKYGQHFLLSCATAQRLNVTSLLNNPSNEIGIVMLDDDRPIGAVAFLDIDPAQRRAELRKLIGVAGERGKGYAEEATTLWIEYGRKHLGLEKIYLSTLQTHLPNIKLNESIGFRVEGVLRAEILLGDARHDVLRMGLCFSPALDED
jgi:RimJ/RimL family protein N-acetyltransferase